MPNSLKSHIETLRAIGSVFAGIPSPCAEREALDAAIESLSRQGGDMSTKPEKVDTFAGRVYGIDISQVEYDRELIAKMLDESADVADCEIGFYSADTLREQASLLRAADDRDAAGVHTAMTAPDDTEVQYLASLADDPKLDGWRPEQAAPGDAEEVARRLDDYLSGEFDIRIGKQAAHAAITAALGKGER